MSHIKGKRKVGENVLLQNDLVEKREYTGLVNKMTDFHGKQFDARNVLPRIVDFYEHTKNYELKANIHWARWFQPFAFLYEKISRRVQQIHLGTGNQWETMHGNIVAIKDDKDGRKM